MLKSSFSTITYHANFVILLSLNKKLLRKLQFQKSLLILKKRLPTHSKLNYMCIKGKNIINDLFYWYDNNNQLGKQDETKK
ncbi:hypothetical protein CWB89_23080 [Pseudoalteromonas piscicida]|uniref:Uncharacterized protein n=1 Tax=Pseudoalteromonas piscicida TaxID=43662 RepID=A0AAQ2EQV1_PSEO7|nr:hypothetical protein TW75_18100 [Pseudoalteromonas piscicida]TMN75309.1 hypothetical protein CWB87_22790 [Pseudoalteromonas flavipulchra]TMN35412.1 hypothetical protein CWB94_20815 [Pseudoalteromonas piscicida]TMN37963.1 hypothetical protein CWB95_14805 [Pseudoalteromonas piscicida]TMN47142.1 hypothetical protein CWB91_21865 [Pseudoalteromonas piscicida]